jgi:hypothetical protein
MLPRNLKYGTKVESAMARSYRTNIAPQNGTGNYSPNDTIIVNIPTRANLCLVPTESYLKFTTTFTNTSGAVSNIMLDSCGAHGLIQRIRVFHGSNLLQDIDNYGLLAKMLLDLQVPFDAVQGKYNVLAGTRADVVGAFPDIATANATDAASAVTLSNAIKAAINGNNLQSYNVNSGLLLTPQDYTTPSVGVANNGTVTNTFCLNLISLVGTLCSSNYIPLFACTSAPLRVEIQLVDNALRAVNATGATSFSLSNVEYIADFIELGDGAMSMIQSSLQGQPLQFVVPDYRNYAYSYALQNATTQVSMPIPAKFSSLKSIFVAFRETAKGINVAKYFPYSCVRKGLTDYQFRVGSQLMPTKSVNTVEEQFSELMKAIATMSDLNHHPAIDRNSYLLSTSLQVSGAVDTDANRLTTVNQLINTKSGSFYVGLDLENYSAASKDTIFAGYNSNTDDIFAIFNFPADSNTQTIRLDAFAMFDEVVVFENGTAYVKF